MSKPKDFSCPTCRKKFRTEHAMRQHLRDKHGQVQRLDATPKKVRAELAAEIFGNLPDGAFFAAANDVFGLDPEDFVED